MRNQHHTPPRHRSNLGFRLVAASAVTAALSLIPLASFASTSGAHLTAPAVTLTVTTKNDTNAVNPAGGKCLDASNKCSVRGAIEVANDLTRPAIINVPAGSYPTTNGALNITSPYGVTINGAGTTKTVLNATGTSDRVIDVTTAQVTLALTNLTLTGGTAPTTGADNYEGGALVEAQSTDDVSLSQVEVSDSTAVTAGGGIFASGVVSLSHTIVTANTVTDSPENIGGGGLTLEWGDATVTDSTFTHNSVTGSPAQGGGIFAAGVLNLTGGSVADNSALDDGNGTIAAGGGLYTGNSTVVTGTSFTGNVAQAAPLGTDVSAVGGGVYGCYGMTSIDDSIVAHNTATSNGSGNAIGGGVDIACGDTTLANDSFTSNAARSSGSDADGGALSVGDEDGSNDDATAQVVADKFTGNVAQSDVSYANGGGVALVGFEGSDGGLTVTSSTFTSNKALAGSGVTGTNGGGGISDQSCGSGSIISNSTFTSNIAQNSQGGGFYDDGCGAFLTGDRFVSNQATGTGGSDAWSQEGVGGGASLYDTSHVTNTVFTHNIADTIGGGIYSDDFQNFSGVTISLNQAPLGAGLYIDSPTSSYVDTSIVDNSGSGASSEGGGVYDNGALTLIGSTIAGNSAKTGGGIYFDNSDVALLGSTVVADNHLTGTTTVSDCAGDVSAALGSIGGNRIGSTACGLHGVGDRQGPNDDGYVAATSTGKVLGFNASTYGGPSAAVLAKDGPVIAMAMNPDGRGYWLVTAKGIVLGYGSSVVYGSAIGQAIVAIAATPDGSGYWLLASNGRVDHFGSAANLGNAPGPARAIAATADGRGYWIVESTGVVKAFGTATVVATSPSANVVGIATMPDDSGFWLVSSTGVVRAYGHAKFYGDPANKPIVAIASTTDGLGYWLLASNGAVYRYGSAKLEGSPAVTKHVTSGLVSFGGL